MPHKTNRKGSKWYKIQPRIASYFKGIPQGWYMSYFSFYFLKVYTKLWSSRQVR